MEFKEKVAKSFMEQLIQGDLDDTVYGKGVSMAERGLSALAGREQAGARSENLTQAQRNQTSMHKLKAILRAQDQTAAAKQQQALAARKRNKQIAEWLPGAANRSAESVRRGFSPTMNLVRGLMKDRAPETPGAARVIRRDAAVSKPPSKAMKAAEAAIQKTLDRMHMSTPERVTIDANKVGRLPAGNSFKRGRRGTQDPDIITIR